MFKSWKRKLALLLACVMLSITALEPVYAAVGEPNAAGTVAAAGETADINEDNTTPLDITRMGEDELEEQMVQAVDNVEERLHEPTADNSQIITSEDGSSSLKIFPQSDGTQNVLFDSDEEFVKEEGKDGQVEGCEYVGTGEKSGISVYKKTMTLDEAEEMMAEYEEDEAAEEETVKQLIDFFKSEPLSDEQIMNALAEADEYSEEIKNKYFRRKATASEATASEATASEAATREESDRKAEASESTISQISENKENLASSSETKKQGAATTKASASQEDLEQDIPAVETLAAAATEESSDPDNDEAHAEETVQILGDGAVVDDSNADSDESKADGIVGAGAGAAIPNNMDGSDYELILEPEAEDDSRIKFISADVSGADEEVQLSASSVLSASSEHTTVSESILIIKNSDVCFYVEVLDEKGNPVGGANGAAIYVSYSEYGQTKTKSGYTSSQSDKRGYTYFEDMSGTNECFVNVSLPGFATQTRFKYILEGGKVYKFSLRPVKNGDVYLRGASIDGVDILNDTFELALEEKKRIKYDIDWLVTKVGASDLSEVPNAFMRTEPERPSNWETDDSKYAKGAYRDKIFKAAAQNYTSDAAGQKTALFSKSGMWSQKCNIPEFPQRTPTSGDNTDKVRFTAGNKVYIDLPEEMTWAGTDKSYIQLGLTVENAVITEKFTWPTIGLLGNGNLIKFNSTIPGLKNGTLNCQYFNFRPTVALTPAGKGVLGYNVTGPMQEIVNTLKTDDELMSRPGFQVRGDRLREKYKKNKELYKKNKDSLTALLKQSKKDKKTLTNVSSLKVDSFITFCGTIEYSKKDQIFNLDLVGGLTVIGTGNVTEYFFVGPVPVNFGVDMSVSFSGSITAGMTFEKGLKNFKFAPNLAPEFILSFSLAAFIGAGLRGVGGVEVNGGGFLSYNVHATAPTLTITAGYNLGIRVYVLFLSYSADLLSDTKQLYPKEYDKALLKAGIRSASAKELLSAASSEDTEPMYVTANVSEGRAQHKGGSGSTELFVPYTKVDASATYTDETEVAETQLLSRGVSASPNTQYITFGKDGNNSGGVLLRIANVETECRDGKTRVLPRVVATVMRASGRGSYEFVLKDTYVNRGDENFDDWETGRTYDYDYSFSAVGEDGYGNHKVIGNQIYFAVTSGPENQEDLEKEAVEESRKNGTNQQEALLNCRAKYQHLRVLCYDYENDVWTENRIIKKKYINTSSGVRRNTGYAYIGTPIITGETVAKYIRGYSLLDRSDLSSVDLSSCRVHWWATCLISSDPYGSGAKSDGYCLARYCGIYKDEVSTEVKADGEQRSNINLLKNPEQTNTEFDGITVVSTMEDGTRNEGTPETESTIRKLGFEMWYYKYVADDAYFRFENNGSKIFPEGLTNLAHANNDPKQPLYFMSGGDVYEIDSVNSEYTFNTRNIRKLNTVDLYDNKVTISCSDNSVNYFRYVDEVTGKDMLNIVTGSNMPKASGENSGVGDKVTRECDAQITIYTLEEEFEDAEDTTRKCIVSGPNTSTFKDTSIYMMTGGLIYDDVEASAPDLKLFYFSNPTEKETDTAFNSDKFVGYRNMCNLYVWNWKADYGAKMISLNLEGGLDAKVVAYEKKKFTMSANYKNIAPKKIAGIMLEWYPTIDGVEGTHHIEYLDDQIVRPGDYASSKFDIDIESGWHGWVTINAAIVKVKANGKWIDSNEAGFKPVWITSGDLNGQMKIRAERDSNFDGAVNIETTGNKVIYPENIRVKVYREMVKSGGGEKLETEWEQYPYQIVTFPATETVSPDKAWNLTVELADEDGWFRGVYTDNFEQLKNRYENITHIDYSKAVHAVRMELCGYGDDTWNVVYDSAIMYNPLLVRVCHVDTVMNDQNAGYITGGGYFIRDVEDGSLYVTLKANLEEGYEVTKWTELDECVERLVPNSKRDTVKLNLSDIYRDYHYVTFMAHTRKKPDYFFAQVTATESEDDESYPWRVWATLDDEVLTPVSRIDGSAEYPILAETSDTRKLELTADYDYHYYKFVGWFEQTGVTEDGEAIYGEKPVSTKDTVTLPVQQGVTRRLKAEMLPQDNPIITFDGKGGYVGADHDDIATGDDGRLTEEALDYKGWLYGHSFDGWFRKDGTPVTADTVFTEDETVYASYTQLEKHLVIIRSNYPGYGSLCVDGICSDTVIMDAYEGDDLRIDVYPDTERGYQYDFSRKNYNIYTYQGGTWKATASEMPCGNDGEQNYYSCHIGEADQLIVFNFAENTQDDKYYIYTRTNIAKGGEYIVTIKPSIVNGSQSKLVEDPDIDNAFRVEFSDPAGIEKFELSASPLSKYYDDYIFDGWYRYTLDKEGGIVLGEKLPGNTFEVEQKKDQRLFAKFTRKKEQIVSFAEDTTTITTTNLANDNQLTGNIQGEVTYSSSDPSIIGVNPIRGDLYVPSKSGTVTITANVKATDEYASAVASYTLIINKSERRIYFSEKEMSAPINSSFSNPIDVNSVYKYVINEAIYESSDPTIAEVYSGGAVKTGSRKGDTVITATLPETGWYYTATASYILHVVGAKQNLEFDETLVRKTYGDSAFTNALKGAVGKVIYDSSEIDVARVDGKGRVTIKKPGTAVITAYAEATDLTEATECSYILIVAPAKQELEFAATAINKYYSEETFTNKLTGAIGDVTYSVSDSRVAAVDEHTGEVTMRNAGDAVITAKAAATEYYGAAEISYDLHVMKAEQKAYFKDPHPQVEYHSGTYMNELVDAYGNTTYSIVSQSTRPGVPAGWDVADLIRCSGLVYAYNAGTITIRAEISETSRYKATTAEYTLTVTPKSLYDVDIDYKLINNELLIFDDDSPLSEGTSYTLATVQEADYIKYIVTGIGNYDGEFEVCGKPTQRLAFDSSEISVVMNSKPFVNQLYGAKTELTYSSDNPKVAAVSKTTGEVKPGKIKGTAVITVKAKEDDYYNANTASYVVHVTGNPQELKFEHDRLEKPYGAGIFTNALSGAEIGNSVEYESSDTSVARVNSKTGEITVVHPGTAIITACAPTTPTAEPGTASFTLAVTKAAQAVSFASDSVTKRYDDAPFINELSGNIGKATYTVSDDYVASVDGDTGLVTIKDTGRVTVKADIAETELYAATSSSYAVEIGKALQHTAFTKASDSITYGEETYYNEVKNGIGLLSYSIVSETPASGVVAGAHVAVIRDSKGTIEIRNAGTVTVRAVASATRQYEKATAEYVLTVAPKSMKVDAINYYATNDTLMVFDGTDQLTQGRDYTYTKQSKDSTVTYTITGKGNYKDTVKVDGISSKIVVVENCETKIDESIPEKDRQKAKELSKKVSVSGFDSGKVPTGALLDDLVSHGELTQSEIDSALAVGIFVNVDVTLFSINDATGEYKYSLDPWAMVVLQDASYGTKIVNAALDPAWFDNTRNITVTLGVGDTAKTPNRVTHIGDDGKVIGVYTAGTAVTGKQFVYDETNRTVTLLIEHCSDIVISHVETKIPDGNSGGGSGGGGGGGGGFIGGGTPGKKTYSSCWFKNSAGQWMVKDQNGSIVRSAWFCDDGVPANGKNVWYLINADGTMSSAGLVQDLTGNFYSLETNHNGFYGMLRYNDGCYDCNGTNVYLQFEHSHTGAFAAIKNPEGIEQLKKIYGVTHFNISNANIVYASNILQ